MKIDELREGLESVRRRMAAIAATVRIGRYTPKVNDAYLLDLREQEKYILEQIAKLSVETKETK